MIALMLVNWAIAQSSPLLDLQIYKEEKTFKFATSEVKVINLNKNIGRWFLLSATTKGQQRIYNLEIPFAVDTEVTESGFKIKRGTVLHDCPLWKDGIVAMPNSAENYVPLCRGIIYLRQQSKKGYESNTEAAANSIRGIGSWGEELVDAVKSLRPDQGVAPKGIASGAEANDQKNFPFPAKVESKIFLQPRGLGIDIGNISGIQVGQWYKAENFDGVSTSVIYPAAISKKIMGSYPQRVNGLDGSENNSQVYLVAFDLENLTLGWTHGTTYPGVGWSSRARNVPHNPVLGPDGFNSAKPLEFTGQINPILLSRSIATFPGGFHLEHGAFKYGKYSSINKASHYGYIENGVVLATPSPDLATLIVYKNGKVDMKSWTAEDKANQSEIVFARQNGVPLIEGIDAKEAISIPGEYVGSWGPGNWSGSAEAALRTPRGAACLVERENKRFLVYAFFSSHTPNSIARVFQAYGCKYAIHLDMNSASQSYAAVFKFQGSVFQKIEHPYSEMKNDDIKSGGEYFPRNTLPDNKDFFWVMRKEQ